MMTCSRGDYRSVFFLCRHCDRGDRYLFRHLRKGDVVLVDGQLRINQLVKYATQSPWSHCTLYVGDELLRRGGEFREVALECQDSKWC